MMAPGERLVEVPDGLDGERLDAALARMFGLSRSRAAELIGDGLVRTGVARRLGDWLNAKAGSSETRLIALLMLVVCGLGAVMSSTAVTAIFIPVALRIAQSTGRSPSRLMMPLSFDFSRSLNTVACSPTMAPPNIFGVKLSSFADCRMPTELSG